MNESPFPVSLALDDIAKAHALLMAELKRVNPISAGALFGAMLTVPALQSNCLRLEVLAHLSVAICDGSAQPSSELADRAFADLGKGICGRFEDPAEDVFVSSIGTPRGNFRVLGGIWESAAFYVQRVMNVVEKDMPQGDVFDRLRDAVYALLRLSELVCERAELARNHLGNPTPEDTIPWNTLPNLDALRQRVRFNPADLAVAGVSPEALRVFALDWSERKKLQTGSIGHSLLERYPLIRDGDDYYFVLPTASTMAIRRFLLERMVAMGNRDVFVKALGTEYGRFLFTMPILGSRIGAEIEFTPGDHANYAGTGIPVDTGRYLGVLFVLDDLAGFEQTGIAGLPPDSDNLGAELSYHVASLQAQISARPDFSEGLLLVVGCGLGRGAFAVAGGAQPWRLEALSAPDLATLSMLPDFNPLILWRILDAQDVLADLGVELVNVNGLLNLVAWVRSQHGHLVPHGHLPENFGKPDAANLLSFVQNALRTARHEAALAWDPHVEQNPEGRWVPVIKIGQSFFDEDRRRPLYGEFERGEGEKPRAVYVTSSRSWWCALEIPGSTPGDASYDRWMMINVWLARAVPILDRALQALPPGTVLWQARFLGTPGNLPGDVAALTYERVRAHIAVTAHPGSRTFSTIAAPEFEYGFFNEENVAERALVDAMIEAVTELAGQATAATDRADWLRQIVPDTAARHVHAFRINDFRDMVRDSLPHELVSITDVDGAALVLGLGWRIRGRTEPARIEGEAACTTYLNALVKHLEDQLCQQLRAFNRVDLIDHALRNHEAAAVDRERWSRSASAVQSLHDDKAATREKLLAHEFELNAIFLSTRLLVEFAICECPLLGGRPTGALDLARLMSSVRLLFEFGSWSDAIRWQAMEPLLAISPLGEVRHNQEFFDSILKPFSRSASDLRLRQAIEKYADNLKERKPVTSVHGLFEPVFLEAIEEECGASLDQIRLFMDFVDDLGVKAGLPVLRLRRSALLDVRADGQTLAPAIAGRLVDFLTLKTRSAWRDVPPGYGAKDLHPWRFRRRLSALRKPLLQVDDAECPTIVVAPGLLREGFLHALANYHRGDYPDWQLKPKMSAWAGRAILAKGHAFAEEVSQRMRDLGWKTEPEINVTKLLRKGFDRNYGDVDVLAWKAETGRVLIIECKDVQYRKTHGEVAEQLADFRGELRSNGKPDELRKHLDRVELISKHLPQVARFMGVSRVQRVESHLVFKNPVPMQYALHRMSERVTIHTFADLATI